MVYQHHARLSQEYCIARPLKGEILSIIAQENKPDVNTASKSSLSELGFYEKMVGGGHYSMLTEPYVQEIARYISDFIDMQMRKAENSAQEPLSLP